jgi:class 3 adenylate cyclase/putative methionine-R-sulfoxide reductase with GAF domain
MSAMPDSKLANPEQLIADLQRQLAECGAERDEALAQQTATAEVLQVINSSPGDLAPVFDAILEKAHALCGATMGGLAIFDGEQFRFVAAHGLTDFVEHTVRPSPDGNAPLDQLTRGEPLIHLADVRAADAYREIPRFRSLIDARGVRTFLVVPLRKDGALLGAIGAYRQEVRPFSYKQIALLQNFAAQAVIAMENARLLTETGEALEQQTATADVLQVINSSPGDLAPVFDAILKKAHSLCGVEYGVLLTYDGELFWPVAMHGTPPTFTERREGIRPSSGFRGLVRGERLLHIHDMAKFAAQRPDEPVYRELFENGGIRTQLAVPLRNDSGLLGIITANRRQVRPFSDKEIALFENFAAQAVIAMENARLLNATREALDQQTATAEVLQVINSSPGDLTPVFEVMLERAIRLCEAAYGVLWTYNGEGFRAATLHGVPQPFAASLSQEPNQFARGTNTALGQIAEGSDFAHFDDVATEEGYMISGARRLIELGGARTVMVVALRKDGKLLGAISAFRQEVRPFADQQIALLQNFAAQAVIAMENARLITETREALEQQTATAEVLGVINSSPGDLGPVFDAMLEKAVRLCDAAFGILWTYDGDHFHAARLRDVTPAFAEFLREPMRPVPGGTFSRLLAGEPVAEAVDIAGSDSYRDGTSRLRRAFFDLGGAQTALFVALRKDQTLLGAFTIYRKEVRPFAGKQTALVTSFAAQAVIAMENARLLGELRARTEEVAELNRGLEARVAEQVDELGRVGRLKRFLAPQLAELIVSQGDEKILESHRREIVVVFCDLRGYTAFTETAEPEEVLDFLREYHGALGPLVSQYEGTLDQFSGDGIMVFFNDPVPCADPAERAVKMAIAMREEAGKLIVTWRRDGCELGFGAGIAQGYATLGQIGFSERSGYTAIGTVCNLAARLCAEAKDGQILVSSRVARAAEAVARLEDLGNLELKGLRRPVAAFNVVQSTSSAEARPNLTVVARGPGV